MAGTGRVYRIPPMELLAWAWDLAVHLDVHLAAFVAQHGVWVYALLFAIVFCETGLVVTPFLPGDSLLFVVGTLAAAGGMDIGLVMAVLVAAALCGDNVNYWIGRWAGMRIFGRWINPVYLQRTHDFYEHHGGKTIIIARFMPIVRTYVPFVAGLGAMPYARYIAFCVAGALLSEHRANRWRAPATTSMRCSRTAASVCVCSARTVRDAQRRAAARR